MLSAAAHTLRLALISQEATLVSGIATALAVVPARVNVVAVIACLPDPACAPALELRTLPAALSGCRVVSADRSHGPAPARFADIAHLILIYLIVRALNWRTGAARHAERLRDGQRGQRHQVLQ
jgi:hypothetical protein